MSGIPKTAAQYSIEHAQRRIRTNAADLRKLADSFDRAADALGKVPSPGRQRAAEVAAYIIHEHAVWLMNASLHTAVEYAAEADLCRAKERKEGSGGR